jgi:hypothetical protein
MLGFAITWPERPKATAIAVANNVFLMVVPLKNADWKLPGSACGLRQSKTIPANSMPMQIGVF